MFARRLHLPGLVRDAPKLSLPGKLVFPRYVSLWHSLSSQSEIKTVFFWKEIKYKFCVFILLHEKGINRIGPDYLDIYIYISYYNK